MADLMGGWYLNNKGVLEYRLLNGDGNQTTTVLASVAGLANLKAGTGEDAEKVLVKKKDETSGETEWKPIGENDIKISGESGDGTTTSKGKGTIKIGSSLLGTSKITVTGNSKLYDAYLNLQDADDKVHIEGTEGITYNTTAGTAVVTGDLSKGFTLNKLDGTATQATYSDAKTNQTLATVSGLAKNYTEGTVELDETTRVDDVVTAGTITLFKADAAGKVSALGTTAIKVAMSNIANANGIAYYLALGEGENETYAQDPANDETAYWTVKGTTATYQYVSPTGYQLANAAGTLISDVATGGDTNATQVKITAAKTTVVATVTGLAADLTTNITDEDQYPKAVGTGQARFGADGKDTDGETITDSDDINPNQFVSGITITADVDGANHTGSKPTTTTTDGVTTTTKGSVTINISKVALPTSGTVTVTAGKDFTVSTTTSDDFNKTVVKDQLIWVVSGNKAIYEKVDLAYYTVTDKKTDKNGSITTEENLDKNGNKITRIICKPQGKATVLATITGLDADYLANEANLVRGLNKDTNGVITHIKGINATDGTDAVTEKQGNKTVTTKAAIPGEITLSKEVLGTTNVSLAKSDNYRLALATTANSADGTTAVALPTFSNYKWNLIGTTATLKGDVTAGYTSSDDGKTITYTAAGDNQTLATVSGLKKGTQLNSDATTDTRTIGNDINSTFTAGVVADTTALSHKTIEMTNTPDENETKYNIKALNRLPITLSKHVMDGKVTLNSNFFTLAVDKKDVDGTTTPSTLTAKADSRTYVIEKYADEVYAKNTETGKDELVTNADAIVGWHGSLGSTAILKQTAPACYELVTDTYGTTKTINYTAVPKTTKTLATIKGLNSAITEDDISFNTGTQTITINNSNALTTGNVTITGTEGYKLALATKTEEVDGEEVTTPVAGLGEATLDNYEWSQATNGTVSFKANVTGAGYKLNADQNIITYTKEASTATTLATITGLRAGLLDDESNTPPAGVTYNETDGIITLSKSALGTAKAVVLSGAGNYKLEVDSTIGTTEKTDTDAADRWVISGTNAILKKVIPDYYTLNGNTLTHIPETDVKYTADEATAAGNPNLKGKSIVYGTIQGLKSGLTVDSTGQKIGYYKNGAFVEAITVDANNKITISDAGVLDYKNSVKLDKTASDAGYTIKLSSDLVDTVKPALVADSTPAWTVSKGTATYKGSIGAGYANSSDNKSIVFSAANNNATIATITGLKTTLTNSDVTEGLTFGTNHTGDDPAGDDESNIITVNADMLGTTDAKLTTNIAILGKDYKLALDDEVPIEASVEDDNKNIWTIDSTNATSTTATYGTWKDTHYALNDGDGETSDTITYYKAGVADDDKIVTVTGLAGNLVTIKDGQIRGITVGKYVTGTVDSETTFEADEDGTIIQLSSTVLPTTVGNFVELTKGTGATGNYELVLDSTEVSSGTIPTPGDTTALQIVKGDYATVTITEERTAGFVYDGTDTEYNTSASDKTKLVYKANVQTGDKAIGTIEGLNKNISNNDDGSIDGITVGTVNNVKTITLSSDVLTNKDVTLKDSDYVLALDDVQAASKGPIFKSVSVSRGQPAQYELWINTSTSGYTLAQGGKSITYETGGNGGECVGTITGLKNTTDVVVDTTAHTITLPAGALNAQNVTIELKDDFKADNKKYRFALNGVAESEETDTWTLTNGTATFTQAVSAGYAVDSTGNVIYTPASSIVSTFTNFNKALGLNATGNELVSRTDTELVDDDNDETTPNVENITAKYGITFTPDATTAGKGKFTITDANLLAHKNVKLTTKATGKDSTGANVTADYTIELGEGVAAEVYKPVWNKATNATVATYTRTTAAGYSLDSNSKNITYSSDPTTVTLATVSGLNKESVVGTTTISSTETPAIGIQTDSEDPETFTAGLVVTTAAGDEAGVITISGNVLNNAKVALGKSDNYTFTLDETAGNKVPTEAEVKPVWAQNKTTATYKNVSTAYYGLDSTSKTLNYTPQADYKGEDGTASPNIVTISGLKSGITINADGTVKNANGTSSTGLTVNRDESIKLSAAVLGTTNVTADNTTVLVLDDDVITLNKDEKWEGQTEWVDAGRGSYTYQTYDKAYYSTKTANDKTTIEYHKPDNITAYATISGLLTGLTDDDIDIDPDGSGSEPAEGGVITLGKDQLGTGTVKLTTTTNATGDFTLALDTDTTGDNYVTESKITDNSEEWTTKTTTATLTGTKTAGYTVSEDKKSITYQADAKTVTLATVKGIKSGATIATTDISDELTDPTDTSSKTGNKIITLKADQLGTTNVTVTGDGYKLAIDSGAESQTDDATWVKAANATKATFTQTTYNGFRESTDGKSLIYQKNTGTVDLATINGLSKDITTDDMAIIAEAEGEDTLLKAAFGTTGKKHVVINTTTKEIYLDRTALNAGAVTLGKSDDYTLKLYGTTTGTLGGGGVTDKVTFDKTKGTMSIVSGTDEAWKESTDGKSLTYTKAKFDTAATVTGLPKTLTYTEGATNPLQGITVSNGTITIDEAAILNGSTSLLANNGKIVLTNNTVGETLSTYTLAAGNGLTFDNSGDAHSPDKKKWVLNGTKLTLKEVTSAYYTTTDVVENTRNKTSSQTVTYVAEKVGGDLAVITGLPTGLYQKDDPDDQYIYLSDKTKQAIKANSMTDMNDRTIELESDLIENSMRNEPNKALTISIATVRDSAKQYTFSETGGLANPTKPGGSGLKINYTTTPTKGTATFEETISNGWKRESSGTKVTYTTEYGNVAATFNGLNKNTDYSTNGTAVSIASESHEATVKAAALTNSNVTVTMPKGYTTPYTLTLGSDVNSSLNEDTESSWKNITSWAVSGGTATYKTYDEANYYIKPGNVNSDGEATTPNSIIYVAPTKGTAYATITGLNKTITSVNQAASENNAGELIITLGATELEGTTKVVLANGGAKTVSAGKNMTEDAATALNEKIEAGNETSAKFKLALDTDVTASDVENAVWDNNGKVATLTGTKTAGYTLSNDQKTITYQSADSKLQTIAKVTGIKSGSQITDDDVTNSGDNDYLPNFKKITLTQDHLGTDNVVLTGEGYKLALDDAVLTASESVSGGENSWKDQTEWVNNNGTFVYKTYNKGYYTLDENTGMRVTYTAAKDDTKTAGTQHKTYLTISGLSKTATPTLAAAGDVAVDNSTGAISVTTASTGVIELTDAELNKANVKLTDSQNGGYSLALGENVTKSTVSNDSAVISGTKATWTGTQGKGYLLANDEQNITYYSAAKTKQTIATVTGLASSITSANNDAFSEKYTASTNTVSLGAADLGDKVTVGGTAAFDFTNYKGYVTGSGAADKMTFAAGGNSINAGGGNDVIDLGADNPGNNVFFYANGNGNDVISGFTAETDSIKVTNVAYTKIEISQDTKIAADALVKVNNNTIRLKGVTASDVKVYAQNDTEDVFTRKTAAEAGNIFADDNYAMTPNLSSIVKSSTASYAADDLVADDATSLTKQSTAVSYSDKK